MQPPGVKNQRTLHTIDNLYNSAPSATLKCYHFVQRDYFFLGFPPGSTLVGREGGASKIELGTWPRSLITISDCSGGGAGLPPLSTHLSVASAHCETPKDAMTPSSEPRTCSGLGLRLGLGLGLGLGLRLRLGLGLGCGFDRSRARRLGWARSSRAPPWCRSPRRCPSSARC